MDQPKDGCRPAAAGACPEAALSLPRPAEEVRPGRLRLALAVRTPRSDLAAIRAERLARIRASAAAARPSREGDAAAGEAELDALERFLAGFVGTIEAEPAPPQPARLAPARQTPPVPIGEARRPRAEPAGSGNGSAGARLHGALDPVSLAAGGALSGAADGLPRLPGAHGLSRLPGAGPGLVGALIRAGVPDLAALARLGAEELADRLGPIGRLIDLESWTAFARAEAGEGPRPDLPAAG